MKGLILRRFVYAVVALFVVSILVFAATQALPGDAALAQLGKNATPAGLETFRAQFNLDAPVVQQYADWLGNLLTGDLGNSFATSFSVSGLIGDRLLNSVVLMLLAAVIAIPLSILLGIFMAVRRDRAGDRVWSVVQLVVASLPEFVLAIAIVFLLATNVFGVLPAVSALDPQRSVFAQLDMLVLPTLTLALVVMPYITRTVRACMIDALESDYVTMARLKGLPERRVILRHALPNVSGPTFQVVAQSLAYLAGGIVVIEAVFQFPGVGGALVSAVKSRDVPVIQALSLLLAGFYIFVNTLADIGTVAMTPTLRKGSR